MKQAARVQKETLTPAPLAEGEGRYQELRS